MSKPDLEARVAELRHEVRDGFTEMRGKLDGTAAGLEQITGLLDTLIAGQSGTESDEQ